MRTNEQTNKLYVHRFAEEPQRRSRGGRRRRGIASEATVSLVIIDAEQGERELDLILQSPNAAERIGAIQSAEDRTEAEHVESLVAAESEDDRADGGGRRRGDVAEAEVLPERIVVAS